MANNMDKKNDAKKEGGKGIGNPIAYIKHLVKDPITNIQEADARKKEIMPWLFGSIGVAAVFSILSNAVESLGFLMIFGFVGIVGIMLFGFLLFIIKKAKEKFKALTCNKCNTMAVIETTEDFAKYVSYTLGANVAVYKGVSHPASQDGVVSEVKASGEASVVAKINLTCPSCGNVKPLEYHIVPFKCSARETKVLVRDIEIVKTRIDTAVRGAVNDYNDPEKRAKMPYTIHSVHHPRYEERTKPQTGNSDAYPNYNGAKIDYRKEPDEMVEQFFVMNQLDGKIVDLTASKK